MMTLSPYLVFNGNCEEAFVFYEQVFGGKILFMGRYKDVPVESRQFFPGAADEQIMHATLQINPATVIMGNDNVAAYQGAAASNFFLYVSITDEATAYRIFNQLSAGGKMVMPMAPTFWVKHYGIVTDRFGISWKISVEADAK